MNAMCTYFSAHIVRQLGETWSKERLCGSSVGVHRGEARLPSEVQVLGLLEDEIIITNAFYTPDTMISALCF